ncbi:low temperature requirement protein A [Micromonospora cathayae]|uniref:Low temperature requirement protein A n=1 Tax=Micromonospora cathayae TaxID=3028804 RepID=A0ABY7ZPF5_9ACTN|nr:low temperature requirement protein A [Micromonospora sp. HUAS 3]WDZ84311.1 low temperature requirement protein A [Micromonospora sp. HUAS 3]
MAVRRLLVRGGPGTRVTRLELFYDLVFVFAFVNVTTLAAADLTVRTLVEALLVLALLWWCWTGFAVLGNVLRADQGVLPLVGFLVMSAVLVLTLTTATAFVDEPGGLFGPLVFATAYLLTWLVQAPLAWRVLAGVVPVRRMLSLVVPTVLGSVLILAAGLLPATRVLAPEAVPHWQLGLWVLALLVQYATGFLVGRTGFRLGSPGHWAERHALIVLVALGESMISLGTSTSERVGRPITWTIISAAVLGLASIAMLWWLYFDTLAYVLEQVLHGPGDGVPAPLARDAYTYLHLPLIVAVIAFALGLKRLLADVTGPAAARPDVLGGLDLLMLFGGVALFLLALAVIEFRALGRLRYGYLLAAAGLAAVSPLADRAMVALTVVSVCCTALVVVELATNRALRSRARGLAMLEQQVVEEAAVTFRHGRR